MTIENICETFAFLDSWQERYSYIIELGQHLPPFPEQKRISAHKVSGCVSQVWVTHALCNGKLTFIGDSDSHLVKGLMAIVFAFYAEKTPAQVAHDNIDPLLIRLQLTEGLTPQRSNGLRALIYAIKNHANAYLTSVH